jgi:SAM-dependent methyltransferase
MVTAPLVQGFYLVPLMAVLHDTGLADALASGPVHLSAFCERRGVSQDDLGPFITYLADKGALEIDDDVIRMSAKGHELLGLLPYGLLHFAYQGTLSQRVSGFVRRPGTAGRDVRRAAEASGLINSASTFATVIERYSNPSVRAILDLGCGNGTFLALYGARCPNVRLAGVDSDERALGEARARLASADLQSASVADVERIAEVVGREAPDLIFASFVLHEVAAEPDRLESLLRRIFAVCPSTRMVVTECYAPSTENCRRYVEQQFAEFKLFHALTGQKLLSRQAWCALVDAAGAEVADTIPHFGEGDGCVVETLIIRRAACQSA